jgi:hypothetical protein
LAIVDEKSHVAEVIHRYEPSPLSVEKAAERKAAEKRRSEEAKRKEAEKRAASRSAHRGAAGLRRERTKFERVKRLRLEMQVAERRGELISRETVLKQASFIFVSLRQTVLNFPSRYAREMVGITDPRQATAVLTRAAHEFLNELAGFPEKMTASADSIDGENGAPLRQDDEGPTAEG